MNKTTARPEALGSDPLAGIQRALRAIESAVHQATAAPGAGTLAVVSARLREALAAADLRPRAPVSLGGLIWYLPAAQPERFGPETLGWRWRHDWPCVVCGENCGGVLLAGGQAGCGRYCRFLNQTAMAGGPPVHLHRIGADCPCGVSHRPPTAA